VDECKPLPAMSTPAARSAPTAASRSAMDQGLALVHFSAQLKRFLRDMGYISGCVGGVWGVLGGIKGCLGCILCQKRLRLSRKVDDCKPLPWTAGPPPPACPPRAPPPASPGAHPPAPASNATPPVIHVSVVIAWSLCGHCMGSGIFNIWSAYGQCMVSVWSLYGLCVVSVWSLYGPCAVSVWSLYGPCVVRVWSLYGPCVVRVWSLNGPCMVTSLDTEHGSKR